MDISIADLVRLILIDIAIVAGASILIGAIAPRVSPRLLSRDFPPVVHLPWETPRFFRALRVQQLARRLPELGDTFGGASKNQLPGRSVSEIDLYLVEVRRAEWVHWFSVLTWIPLIFFNPWWLTLLFAVIVVGGNTLFLLVLRRNRERLTVLKRRLQSDT